MSTNIVLVLALAPDLNIPIAGIAMVLVLAFLNLPTPPGTLREKLSRMDWM
jgi:hypothetical protein